MFHTKLLLLQNIEFTLATGDWKGDLWLSQKKYKYKHIVQFAMKLYLIDGVLWVA